MVTAPHKQPAAVPRRIEQDLGQGDSGQHVRLEAMPADDVSIVLLDPGLVAVSLTVELFDQHLLPSFRIDDRDRETEIAGTHPGDALDTEQPAIR